MSEQTAGGVKLQYNFFFGVEVQMLKSRKAYADL